MLKHLILIIYYLSDVVSNILTLYPATALATIAMPVPIYPAPTTPNIVEPNVYLIILCIYII